MHRKPEKMLANFCRMCGGKLELLIPPGDDRWRHACPACGYLDYINPKLANSSDSQAINTA